MFTCNLILYLAIFSTIYLGSHALIGESIISNNLAYLGQFPYQVAIMGKPNGSDEWTLQGSGGIIGDQHILSAAQCVIDENGDLKEFTFSVVINEVDLTSDNLIYRDVVRIYLPQSGSYANNDLTVLELPLSLNLSDNPHLKKLDIPTRHRGSNWPLAIVAGYGYHDWSAEYEEGSTDRQLRFEPVLILPDRNCVIMAGLRTTHYFCGKMFRSEDVNDKRSRGLCLLDYGSPLVIENLFQEIVVGVASTSQDNCDDEDFGGLYTNVANNYHFIDGVLQNSYTRNTLIYANRHHNMVERFYNASSSMSWLTIN